MKRYIKAESLVDTFLRYHDDEGNYARNSDGFDKMYSILEKYDTSNGNDPVDVAFLKATPEDQKKMIDLITPRPSFGTVEYCRQMYHDALDLNRNGSLNSALGEDVSEDYCNGITDAFEALFEAGLLERSDITI